MRELCKRGHECIGSGRSSFEKVNIEGIRPYDEGVGDVNSDVASNTYIELDITDGEKVSFTVKTTMNLGSNGIISSGDASFANVSFTGVETAALELNSKTITIATGDRTTNTSDISTSRLVVDGAYHLTEYDLRNSSGLIYSWLTSFNYATNSSVQDIESKFVSTWNTEDNTKIPTQAAISNYMSGVYVPLSSIEQTTLTASSADKIPSSKAVATFVTGLLTSTVNSTTSDKAATPKAIYDYYGAMITVSSTQPTGNRAGQLWINTSMGNGVLYYYNGSAWKTISSVWT